MFLKSPEAYSTPRHESHIDSLKTSIPSTKDYAS